MKVSWVADWRPDRWHQRHLDARRVALRGGDAAQDVRRNRLPPRRSRCVSSRVAQTQDLQTCVKVYGRLAAAGEFLRSQPFLKREHLCR